MPDLAFKVAYPFALPEGGGGVAAVAINSKGHLFAFQRNDPGKPQLFEFDEHHKLVRTIGEDVIGAIGVSGAPGGDKDEACAKTGIDKVAADLK